MEKMNLHLYIVLIALIAGCANHTAQITASAGEVRQAAQRAQVALGVAQDRLDYIDAQAASVVANAGYVSDDINPIYSTLQYVSVAVVALSIGAVVYTLRNKLP